jgi:putative FmdB family regulatory protein
MPLYEFECNACGSSCEKLVSSPTQLPKKCPKCGKPRLKRVLFTRPPVAHMKYSPMHPRRGRGMSRR